MKKIVSLAIVPVLLAATPMLALAENAHQHTNAKPAMTRTQQTQAQAQTRMRTTQLGTPAMKTLMSANVRSNPLFMQAQWQLVTRHYPEAVTLFQTLLSNEPNSVHALDGLSTALYSQGRYDEALRQIDKAIALDPINSRLFYTKGQILDAQDRPVDAVEAYLTFTSLTPDDGAALSALARVDELYKRIETKLNPGVANYYEGLRLLSLHQPEQAITLFEQFKSIEPANQQAHILLGRSYLELGQPQRAIPFFESALRAKANNPVAYYQLGSSYELQGEAAQAQNAFRKFLQFAPESEAAVLLNRRLGMRQQ